MAPSSSSSSSSCNWLYDVFPSFSGEDIRKNFLSHFIKELDRHLITAFKDSEIEKSQSIWPELVQAIRNSRIAVVVFSENYASSSWCLNELLEILKCKEEFGQMVIPVFYRLDPSDVRKQTGDFGKIFEKTCKNRTKEVKNRWQKGLTDVANIAGYHSQNCDGEATMIEKIVKDVLSKLNITPLNDFEDLVGLEDHITKMSLLLDLESEEVRMVGIWGTSGIGKTTIARALCSRLFGQFQGHSYIDKGFLSKSMEKYSRSNPDDYNMKLHLQEKFLSKLLDKEGVQVDHLGAVKDKLKNRKILIFIDDLDDELMLNALVGENHWFGSGSRIIVVTKDKQLLKAHGIDCIYEVGLPSEELALEMLCRSAFKKNSPPESFEKLALEIVRSAGSLPLGLRVLGSSLRGREKEYWMNMLRDLQNGLNGKIGKTLRISYDGLSRQDKAIFRHIACLFNFKKVNDIKLMLADSFLCIDIGLQNLVDKSLVHVSLGIVMMHTLLQKMGKEVVRSQSDNPGEREFLVDTTDVLDVLEDNIGTQKVLGISLDIDEFDELHVHESAFKGMRNLRFLEIYSKSFNTFGKQGTLHLPDSFDYLPPKLKLLHWDGYPMKSMPSKFCPEKLVKFKMQNSKLKKLWEGSRKLTHLKEINLWGSENLKEIPDLSMATHLEKLYLGYRLSWVKVPSSVQKFNNLTKMGMLECNNLETRPTESPKRPNLMERSRLCLENVADFCMENLKIKKLWEGMQPLKCMGTTLHASLTVLFLSDIPNMVELPFSIQNLNKLTDLRITRCINLEILPTGINLESLERLNLNGCSRLRTFPDISRNISSLYLEETAIEEVPWWVENFSKLKYLVMQRCSKLEYVYLNLSKLKHLELVDFSHCGALTGTDWNGYPSGLALEGEIIDTVLQVSKEASSSSLPDNYASKVHFSFVNCFNLDQECLLQQLSFEKLILSGEKVPLYFTHRTIGTTLAISLLQARLPSPFLRFRAGAVFVFNSLSKFGVNGVWIKVQCRFKGRLGYHFGSYDQKEYFSVNQKGSHLFIFDFRIPLNSQNDLPSEVDVQFHFSCDASCKMKGWGIRLFENCSSAENRISNPNTLLHIREANMVDETKQGEECRDREEQ